MPDARRISAKAEVDIVIVRGTAVQEGDRIATDAAGLVHLIFSDQTKLVVGPRSSLLIESYLLRSSSTANNFTVRALGGSFRMITGNSEKRAYRINTPTATIGVRGTEFDMSVEPNGATRVVVFSGATDICTYDGFCQILRGGCAMAQAAPRQDVELLEDESVREEQLRANFPFVKTQNPLRADFQVSLDDCPTLGLQPSAPTQRRAGTDTDPAALASPPLVQRVGLFPSQEEPEDRGVVELTNSGSAN
ncbi:hypothetical protein GR183_20145 [Stappia sp. GBMRC 2046]|uniref:FecR protein domain-containing protein n=1 Tax=Stappia sediminis TaxID=2692190 RepID=A0A7X3LY51_9HYPH|nr:hypothetical protein [Stappia sediminis]